VTGVRLEQLTKIYPSGVKAVDNLSVAVAPGEFLAILGPSGCGKTTTLRMVAGLETPTSGSIYFGSRRMNDVPPQRRGVGLVFQQHAVFPNMSVYENVAYGLRVRRVSEPELRRRVMEHLELVGLADLAHRMPAQLSGGQLQRVALARALVIQPSVLLLDEPLSSLDAKLRASIRAEIKKIQRQLGITTVYVTHDQEEALSLADRVGVMHRGVLEQVGPPEEVYRAPATRFVASFVGEGTLLEGAWFRPATGSPWCRPAPCGWRCRGRRAPHVCSPAPCGCACGRKRCSWARAPVPRFGGRRPAFGILRFERARGTPGERIGGALAVSLPGPCGRVPGPWPKGRFLYRSRIGGRRARWRTGHLTGNTANVRRENPAEHAKGRASQPGLRFPSGVRGVGPVRPYLRPFSAMRAAATAWSPSSRRMTRTPWVPGPGGRSLPPACGS